MKIQSDRKTFEKIKVKISSENITNYKDGEISSI